MALSSKMKGSLLAAGAISAVAVGAGSVASAQGGPDGTLVDKIATKFNLNKDEVQAVVDENRAEHKAERAAEVSQNLQTAVEQGKITAEQKTLLESKMKENQAAREAEMTALQEWAQSNNIDMRYVMGGGRHGANLESAVKSGTITSEQKTLIEQKREELEKARDTKRDAMQQWAKDNNIDTQYMRMGGSGGNKGGPRE